MQTCKAFSHRKVFHQGPPVTKSALQLCADFVGVTIYNSELQKSSVPLPNDPIDVIVPTTTLNPSSGKLVAYKNLVFLDSLHGVSFTVKPSNTQQYSLVKIGKTPSIKTSIAVVLQDTLQSSPMVIHNNDPFLAIISYKDKKDRNKIDLLAVPAIFGPILSHGSAFNLKVIILRKRAMMGNEPTAVSDVGTGCVAYSSRQASEIMGKILVVARGSCNFYVKVKFAETAGARAVIVVGDQTKSTTMGAPQPFDTLVDDLTIPSFFVPYPNSQKLLHDKPSLVSISIVFGDLLKAKKFSNYQTSVNGVPINGIMFVNLRHELPAHDGIYRNDYITANPLTRIKCLSKCYQEVCCE
ncbi:hypothetical protein BC833DRAFT_339147 [Globomyces pollinis-pini]|nr:hypothetical protein BC833DRAFT_339147 [Globomyces pollinis-pini]